MGGYREVRLRKLLKNLMHVGGERVNQIYENGK